MELEVIWPKYRSDYLTVCDADIPANPPLLTSTWTDADATTNPATAQQRVNGERPPLTVATSKRCPVLRHRAPSRESVDAGDRLGRASTQPTNDVRADLVEIRGATEALETMLYDVLPNDTCT